VHDSKEKCNCIYMKFQNKQMSNTFILIYNDNESYINMQPHISLLSVSSVAHYNSVSVLMLSKNAGEL
jgi:hypothetical protein